MFGWLCNRIPAYPDTLHLETRVFPQDGDQRPIIRISDVHANHPLYVEQRDGITVERLREIYADTLCDRNRD